MFFAHLLTTIFFHFLLSLEHGNLDNNKGFCGQMKEKNLIVFYGELNLAQEIWENDKDFRTIV